MANSQYIAKTEADLNTIAEKLLADSVGNETSMQLNDWVDVGAFADLGEERLMFVKRVNYYKITCIPKQIHHMLCIICLK